MELKVIGKLYGQVGISQAYRILGLGDRDSNSPTYGCFDRYYWHYRQMDFVNSRFQEAAHFLALLYLYNHPENRFYQKQKVLDWAMAAITQWENIQRLDGSFDEYWPFERSFCVTSFTLYAAAETCRLLKCSPPEHAIRKACGWLKVRENPAVLNQMAASGLALQISAELLNDDIIRSAAQSRIERVLEMQDPSGYFVEYGGYDIGYLTITLSLLSAYALHTDDQQVKDALKPAFRFLDDKIFKNGTFDYQTTSRHSQYFYPFGFAAMNELELLSRHYQGLKNNEVLNPAWLDDRYCLPTAIDYLQTGLLTMEPHRFSS